MPIHIGLSTKNQQQISFNGKNMQKVYVGAKLVWQKNIIPSGLGYGLMYNWYAASNALFAPVGWHLPSRAEWTTLVAYLGGESIAGGKLKDVGLIHWGTPNTGATNEVGFNAFASGIRSYGAFGSGPSVGIGGNRGNLWASDSWWGTHGFIIQLSNDATTSQTNLLQEIKYGLAVRPIKNDSVWAPGDTVTDIDGNIYPTIKIGTQVFISKNYKCTKLNDSTPIPNVTDNTEWAGLTTGAYCAYNNDPLNI